MAAPPIASDIDLGQLPYFPLLRRRLFQSEFHLKATDAEWRAGMTLWIRSWDQQPTGSLPNDDHQLRRLAGLAGEARWKWYRVREMALRGWYLCDDGRLYHNTIAELVNDTRRWTKRGANPEQKRSTSGANREQTKREPSLKSRADFDELNRRESPPISPPPNGGDLSSKNSRALNPKVLNHFDDCRCANCQRWAREQQRATG